MYAVEIDGIEYHRRDSADFSLTDAMRELYGVANARIVRVVDGSVVVDNAGSSSEFVHVPSGTTVRRRDRRRPDRDYRQSRTWCW